jgi:hypothetical protein
MSEPLEIAITYLTPERFARKPQAGLSIRQEWHALARWLTWPTQTEREDKEAKTLAGAFCPCELPDGVVKGGRGPSQLLVADVDGCGSDGFERSVGALTDYLGCVVTSCNATNEDTRHRIVLVTDRLMDPEERALAWRHMNRTLARAGIGIDQGCKNANRLYYGPVWRRGGIFRAAHLVGAPVPVNVMLEAARAEDAAELAARPKPKPLKQENRDRYIAGAVSKARTNVEAADAGARHGTLLREVYGLARFGLSENEISDALLEPFVHAAGESRRREGERAIHDAFTARQGAA